MSCPQAIAKETVTSPPLHMRNTVTELNVVP